MSKAVQGLKLGRKLCCSATECSYNNSCYHTQRMYAYIYTLCLYHSASLRALTACLRIPDWPRRLVSHFAHITAGLGGPKMQLAHLIGSHQWEIPSCTGFSGFAWGLITSQLRRAAISTCLGPVVSATCAILMHYMRGICCLNALPWQISGCNSLHSCCSVPAS